MRHGWRKRMSHAPWKPAAAHRKIQRLPLLRGPEEPSNTMSHAPGGSLPPPRCHRRAVDREPDRCQHAWRPGLEAPTAGPRARPSRSCPCLCQRRAPRPSPARSRSRPRLRCSPGHGAPFCRHGAPSLPRGTVVSGHRAEQKVTSVTVNSSVPGPGPGPGVAGSSGQSLGATTPRAGGPPTM